MRDVLMAGAALAWLVLAGTSADAAELAEVEARHTQAYRDCPGFKSAIDPEMLECISAEFEVQDGRLNAAYARALAALTPEEKPRLRAAQRAWIAYRNSWCVVTYHPGSGSLERISANMCTVNETILQTMRLEALATYGEATR